MEIELSVDMESFGHTDSAPLTPLTPLTIVSGVSGVSGVNYKLLLTSGIMLYQRDKGTMFFYSHI